MPVFFVHDVNHGIVKPLDRKFRVREINPTQGVNATQAIHPKQESDPEDFKQHYAKLKHTPEERKEQPAEHQRAIQAYQEQAPENKLSLGRVKDIMSQPVIHTFQDQSLDAAWKQMQQHDIHHLVILNEQYHYCGLLSEKLITPYLMQLVVHPESLETPDEIKLTHFCKQNLLSTHPETEIADLGPAMLEYGLDAIAVSEHGQIVGIVTKSDVFKVILKHQNFEALA